MQKSRPARFRAFPDVTLGGGFPEVEPVLMEAPALSPHCLGTSVWRRQQHDPSFLKDMTHERPTARLRKEQGEHTLPVFGLLNPLKHKYKLYLLRGKVVSESCPLGSNIKKELEGKTMFIHEKGNCS